MAQQPMKIVILMADMCSATSVAATLEFFECANVLYQFASGSQGVVFDIQTASMNGKPVSCTGNLELKPQKALHEIEQAQLIIVPGFMFNILEILPNLSPMVEWLEQQHKNGSYLASMCTGAFVLAQTGLLDGKTATTHWVFGEQFSKRFPNVKLKIERTVTDEGLLMCSGGSTSSSDLLLHLIRKFASPQLAAECAKKLLVDITPRTQTPYACTTFKKNHHDADILNIQIWFEKNLSCNINMDLLVRESALSMRNFIRRFKDATEQTPIQYLQNLRIEKAKHLLESSKQSFEIITQQVGYEDGNSFRRLFKERVGLSPMAYRKRFESVRR